MCFEKKNLIFLYILNRLKKKKINYIRYMSKIIIVIIYFVFLGVVIIREVMSKRNVVILLNVFFKSFVLLGFMCLVIDLMYV